MQARGMVWFQIGFLEGRGHNQDILFKLFLLPSNHMFVISLRNGIS
jgi:hypothetical protein